MPGRALADTRTNVVFGDGAETAEIMLIGEGPASTRMSRASPFGAGPVSCWTICWRSSIWTAPRSILPLVKCRRPRTGILNVEQDACIGYLRGRRRW